jgi:hypothetical protein
MASLDTYSDPQNSINTFLRLLNAYGSYRNQHCIPLGSWIGVVGCTVFDRQVKWNIATAGSLRLERWEGAIQRYELFAYCHLLRGRGPGPPHSNESDL